MDVSSLFQEYVMYSNRKRIAAAENELKAIVEEDQQIKREERGEEEAVSDTATDVSIYSSSDDESVGSMCDEQVTKMSCTCFGICSRYIEQELVVWFETDVTLADFGLTREPEYVHFVEALLC